MAGEYDADERRTDVSRVSLADFIRASREDILIEWDAFARTCAPASGSMDMEALRDHAGEMLATIARDLDTPQDKQEQAEKSKGHSPAHEGDVSAAEHHGAGRAVSGFSIEQMVAEYRAMRASVIRLWTAAKGELRPRDVEDLTRFNEAIDQALAESVSRYNEEVEHAKEVFLGILGHDMRTPLGAIHTSASVILEGAGLEDPYRALTARIAQSATRTIDMVADLLDFTRSRLGGGIPITREDTDLADVVREVVAEVSAAHPEARIRIDADREQRGEWDQARIRQALSNLVMNAVQHGQGREVEVGVRDSNGEVAVAVRNGGPAIPSEQMDGIFNPMKPRTEPRNSPEGRTGSLGLGLYIAERIVSAHDGRIEVESSEERGTTFTVCMPRHEREAR